MNYIIDYNNITTTTSGSTTTGNITWTTGYINTWVTVTNTPINDFELRKVENGFILKQNYKEFVFESTESMLKWIKDFYKAKK